MPQSAPTIADRRPAFAILTLAIGPAVGLGICRFAYSLVLPDMRDSLDWSYATAGAMNTINAAGYLAGALLAAPLAKRIGLLRAVHLGLAMCLASLVLSSISGAPIPFGLARVLSGVGGAFALVCGSALAASIAQMHPMRAALLIGLFYNGPAMGLIISGSISPFILQGLGQGSWWIVWLVLTAISTVLAVPLVRIKLHPVSVGTSGQESSVWPIVPYLAGYFLYGAGYIAYLTFMIAYIRDDGGGAAAQSAFWCLIGLGGISAPWIWRGLMARGRSGVAMALMIGLTAIGAALPLAGSSPIIYALSALVFGNGFLATTIATTAFARFNYPEPAWPRVIAIITIIFSIGQILGPIITGAITDLTGTLSAALAVSAGALALGALVSLFQRALPFSRSHSAPGKHP